MPSLDGDFLAILDALPDAVTVSSAVRDDRGHAVDMRLQWMNAAARDGQPLPADAIGQLASDLWPQMTTNGSLAACLRALDGEGPQGGEFVWTQTQAYRPASYDYRAVCLQENTLLWVLRDISERFRAWSAAEAVQQHLMQAPAALHLPSTATSRVGEPGPATGTSADLDAVAEPRTPAVSTHGLYRPALSASTIGGDWYDAFELPAGELALSIGDVVGHDVLAAARMAELRATVRALAWESSAQPAEILTRVDAVVTGLSVAPLATAVVAVLDAARTQLRWANAGHPPPLLVRADGTATLLPSADVVLGVTVAARQDHCVQVGAGDTLVLYTDGLVEQRGESLEVGLTRLLQAGGDVSELDLPAAMRHLVASCLVSADGADDVAVLLVRLH